MKHSSRWILMCRAVVLSQGMLLAGAPANDEFNERMAEQKKEMTELVSRIGQAIDQENAVEAEALLAVARNFSRPEIGVSFEVRFVELRFKLSSLRIKLAIKEAGVLTETKLYEEALQVLQKAQRSLISSGMTVTEDHMKALETARDAALTGAADDYLNRLQMLLRDGKAKEADALFVKGLPQPAGNSILAYVGERYSAFEPLIVEALRKETVQRQAVFAAKVDDLIGRMKEAIRKTSPLEQWKALVAEGNQTREKAGSRTLAGEEAISRLEQAMDVMQALIGIGSELAEGKLEYAARNAGILMTSLHEESIVRPVWVGEYVLRHLPDVLTPKALEEGLKQNPDYAALRERWDKSGPIYQNGWPAVVGGYTQVKADLEFCQAMQFLLRTGNTGGFGTLVQRWSGLDGGEAVTSEYGRALTVRALLVLCRKECGYDLQYVEGEGIRSLVRRALQQCADEGKFEEMAVFMPEALKFCGQDHTAVDPFSESPLITSYLAAGRLEAAGDSAGAAQLYRVIVQRGRALYLPIQKAQERLTALHSELKADAAEAENGLREELTRLSQRLDQMEKAITKLQK